MAATMNVIKRTLSVSIARGTDADGNAVTLNIEEPKAHVTKAEIDAAMQVVVENNIFNTSGGDIVEAVEGRMRTIATDVVAA